MSNISNCELSEWSKLNYTIKESWCLNCNDPTWAMFYEDAISNEWSVDGEDDYYICRKCLLEQYKNYKLLPSTK